MDTLTIVILQKELKSAERKREALQDQMTNLEEVVEKAINATFDNGGRAMNPMAACIKLTQDMKGNMEEVVAERDAQINYLMEENEKLKKLVWELLERREQKDEKIRQLSLSSRR